MHEQDVLVEGHSGRYLNQHPANDALRVTLIDQIGGFSSRIEGNTDVVETIQQMLSTFTLFQ